MTNCLGKLSKDQIEILIKCKDKDEAIEQFRIRGYEIDSDKLDAIKLEYEGKNEISDSNNLSIEQLEQVAGGHNVRKIRWVNMFDMSDNADKFYTLNVTTPAKKNIVDFCYNTTTEYFVDMVQNGASAILSDSGKIEKLRRDYYDQVREYLSDFMVQDGISCLEEKKGFEVDDDRQVLEISAIASELEASGLFKTKEDCIKTATDMQALNINCRNENGKLNIELKELSLLMNVNIALKDENPATKDNLNADDCLKHLEDEVTKLNEEKKNYAEVEIKKNYHEFSPEQKKKLTHLFFIDVEKGEISLDETVFRNIYEIAGDTKKSITQVVDFVYNNVSVGQRLLLTKGILDRKQQDIFVQTLLDEHRKASEEETPKVRDSAISEKESIINATYTMIYIEETVFEGVQKRRMDKAEELANQEEDPKKKAEIRIKALQDITEFGVDIAEKITNMLAEKDEKIAEIRAKQEETTYNLGDDPKKKADEIRRNGKRRAILKRIRREYNIAAIRIWGIKSEADIKIRIATSQEERTEIERVKQENISDILAEREIKISQMEADLERNDPEDPSATPEEIEKKVAEILKEGERHASEMRKHIEIPLGKSDIQLKNSATSFFEEWNEDI